MLVKDEKGITRSAKPGDKIRFKTGKVLEIGKHGELRNLRPKGTGKKQRPRPPKQRKQQQAA